MPQTRRTYSILIADENPLFRRGLKVLVSGDAAMNVLGEAADGHEILRQIREQQPEVLIISVEMLRTGESAGLGTLIRQAAMNLRTLVLAREESEENVAAAIACGAKGMMLKGATPAELLAGLRTVAFQEGGPGWAGLLPELKALADQTAPNASSSVLTAREQEVMRLLAEGKTVRTVAHDLCLSMKTIEAHKLNLMRKLDLHDRPSLVAYAQRLGILSLAAIAC